MPIIYPWFFEGIFYFPPRPQYWPFSDFDFSYYYGYFPAWIYESFPWVYEGEWIPYLDVNPYEIYPWDAFNPWALPNWGIPYVDPMFFNPFIHPSGIPYESSMSSERDWLKSQAELLGQQIGQIKSRIFELEKG